MKPLFLGVLLLALSIIPVQAQQTNESAGEHWWDNRVFYEVFVRSFQDSDSDGIGDLQGLISKLDYLNDGDPDTSTDLGITGLWLMPIFASPSYHGYDVTDYMTVNPDYGTNDDYKQLIAEAHKRGIAVIIDMVINHTSSQHPWFIDAKTPGSEHEDWYRWSSTKPAERGPWGQQVWYPSGDRFYYAVFWDQMPDLNFENPDVTQAVDDVARFWLNDMGTDGFRMDAARYFVEDEKILASAPQNLEWLSQYHQTVKSISPEALVVGEVATSDVEVARYVPDSLDMGFEFDLAGATVKSVVSSRPASMNSVLKQALTLYPPGQYATFLTNHDQDRVLNQLTENIDKAKIAASVLLTRPGVPFIYYGEEIGMVGRKPDECIRTPMQWDSTPVTAAFIEGKNCTTNEDVASVAAEVDDPNSLLNHYKTLIQLRNSLPALQTGNFQLVESSSPFVYSFVRQTEDQTLLVVINMFAKPIDDYVLTLEEGGLTNVLSANIVLGEGSPAALTVNSAGGFDSYAPFAELPPYSTTIIQLS